VRRWPLWLFSAAVIAFLLFPVLLVLPLSLNDSFLLDFPPKKVSLRWYEELLDDEDWLDATLRSLAAATVAAVVATTTGASAAIALVRGRFPGKRLLRLLVITPLVVPVIVLAIGMYDLYSDLRLTGSVVGVGLAHAALCLPLVVLVMASAVQNADERLEQAARTLGATGWQAFRRVTLPLLRGALAASAILVFATSFDEVVIAIFIAAGGETLPVLIFSQLETEITPVIAAMSSILVLAVVAALVLGTAGRGIAGRLRPRYPSEPTGE
jgi:putative spermidine/putrescine transport system permease protein